MIFAIARELKMDVREVENWPASLLAEWRVFLWEIVPAEEERVRRKAEEKGSRRGGSGGGKRRTSH